MNQVMYADDICTMAPSPAAWQERIDICIYVQNNLSFNSSKSYCMVFIPKSYTYTSCPRLYMDNQILKYTDDIKYLGFTFSSDQKDDEDLLRQLNMVYTKSNRLLRLLSHHSVEIVPTRSLKDLLTLQHLLSGID